MRLLCLQEFYPGVYKASFKSREVLGIRLTTWHNLRFLINLMKKVRQAIMEDRLLDFRDEFFSKFGYKKYSFI